MNFSHILKFNENHDKTGRFAHNQGENKDGTQQPESSTGTQARGFPQRRNLSRGQSGVGLPSSPPASSEPLQGLPQAPIEVKGYGTITPAPFQKARQVAAGYMEKAGLPYTAPTEYTKVDPAKSARIADAYEGMKHDPNHPGVKAAYAQMIKETESQYQAVIDSGLHVEFIDFVKQGDPYAASPRLAIEDVKKNNHLYVFSTRDGFGSGDLDVTNNPLLASTKHTISGKPALANDLFRVVHDYFGHIKEGVGFRADGEDNAWRSHVSMFSPLAAKAMTTETRGQNSWVNFGPHGESNRKAGGGETVFADQKTGLLPEWVSKFFLFSFIKVLKGNLPSRSKF